MPAKRRILEGADINRHPRAPETGIINGCRSVSDIRRKLLDGIRLSGVTHPVNSREPVAGAQP